MILWEKEKSAYSSSVLTLALVGASNLQPLLLLHASQGCHQVCVSTNLAPRIPRPPDVIYVCPTVAIRAKTDDDRRGERKNDQQWYRFFEREHWV